MTLTIIVPAYNMEKYLAKCCESVVVSQELREHLEVLVVHDGSTDKTSEVAHSFERKYPGTFRVIDKPNGHYGSCVNCGLAESKGEFVKLLDADDTYDKAEFERLLKFLVEGSANGALDDIDLVLTDYRIVDKRGKTLRVVSFGGKIDEAFGVDESIDGRCCSAMCVFRTQLLRDIGYRQTEGILYTDLEWSTFPMRGVRKIRYLPIAVYRYFQGREGQSISAAVAGRRSGDLEQVLSRMVDELGGYRGDKGKESFFVSRLNSVATNLYHNYLICAPLGEVDAGFARADAIVSRHPSLRTSTENVRLSNRLRFHYVAAWRRHRHLPRPAVLLARAYSRLTSWIMHWIGWARPVAAVTADLL